MIPLVFIHFGPCDYAALTLAHARARGNEVVFLNPSLQELHAHPFASLYQHLSTNHYEFELACLTRWFVLRDWLEREGVPDCLYCDTDVLVYANVEDEWHGDPYYIAHDFTLSMRTSGHTSFWKRGAVTLFCEFIEWSYLRQDWNFQTMQHIFAEMRAQGLAGGISDMAWLRMFSLELGMRVGEMSAIRNGATWDHNFNARDDGFMMQDGHKHIALEDGAAFGTRYYDDFTCHDPPCKVMEWVNFKSIHFQGQAKKYLAQYAYDAQRMPQ